MNPNALRPARAALPRRPFALNALALSLALLLPATALGATPAASPRSATMESISFDNSGIAMAGNLYLPAGFDKNKQYPAIVVVHPGGGVKEQTAGLYARQLADEGFIALAFDASHQGASGGEPRFLDDPMKRVSDIYSAVDYLTTVAGVDDARIGALGICAGSGAAVKAAMTERRIQAIATVSAVDVGAASRLGWDGTAPWPSSSQRWTRWPSSVLPKLPAPRRSTCPTCRPSATPPHRAICRKRPSTT